MITKTRVALSSAVAAMLVAVPTAAHAIEFERSSTTGRATVAYDRPRDDNRLDLCDRVSGDGTGAYMYISNHSGYRAGYIQYNGCDAFHLSGAMQGYVTVRVCDWLANRHGARWAANCSSWEGWINR